MAVRPFSLKDGIPARAILLTVGTRLLCHRGVIRELQQPASDENVAKESIRFSSSFAQFRPNWRERCGRVE